MSIPYRFLMSVLLAGTILASSGCAERRYRVYDSYHSDYHRWDGNEDRVYRQYLSEQHRDYVDHKHMNEEQQQAYWNWRHEHPDDHDHDKH